MTGSLHPPQSATATIPLRLARVRRAALLNALVGHGPPAFVLTAAGLGRLWAGATGPALALALAEAAAGLWQATVLVQEARESHHIERSRRLNRGAVAEERAGGAHAPDDSHGGRYSTPHLATGVLLAVEVWHHWHETGHVTRPFVLGALVFLAFGLGGYAALRRRMRRRMALVVDTEGIAWRTRPFLAAPIRVSWHDVTGVAVTHDGLTVRRRGGAPLVLAARGLDDAPATMVAARAAMARHAPPGLLSAEQLPERAAGG